MQRTSFLLPLAFVALLLCGSAAATQATPQALAPALAPGSFPLLEGTRLGQPVSFERAASLPENPPVLTQCFPLLTGPDTMLAWLSAAAVADGTVFVRRCIEGADRSDGSAGRVPRGGEALEWEEVVLESQGAALVTRPLALPDWSFFSNPSFCGQAVAYWAMRGTDLLVQVYDLRDRRVLGSQSRGEIYLVADESDALEAPVWAVGCGRVSFAASRLGSRVVVISLE